MDKLSNDVIENVLVSFLDWKECFGVLRLNREWNKLMKDKRLWPKVINVDSILKTLYVFHEPTETELKEEIYGKLQGTKEEKEMQAKWTSYFGFPKETKEQVKRKQAGKFIQNFLDKVCHFPIETLIMSKSCQYFSMEFVQNMPLKHFDAGSALHLGTQFVCLKNKPLRYVNLSGCKLLLDEHLIYLQTETLQVLDLSNTNIHGGGFNYLLGHCKHLTSVNVNSTKINDATLTIICQLPLQSLFLDQTEVTDDILPLIQSIPKLSFKGVNFTAAAVFQTWPKQDKTELIKRLSPALRLPPGRVQHPVIDDLWESWQGMNWHMAEMIRRDLVPPEGEILAMFEVTEGTT